MQYSRLIACALAIPALVAFSIPEERITFSPESGTVLTKTFKYSASFELDDMEMLVNGQAPPPQELNISGTSTGEFVFVDEFTKVADGRPSELKRTFETIKTVTNSSTEHPMMGSQESSIESSSELEGMTVSYRWNDENEEFDLRFVDDEDADEELLEELLEDTDLRQLLPEESVSKGDSWEIDPNSLIALLAPAGDLKMKPTEEPEPGSMGSGMESDYSAILGDLEGSFTGELTGIRMTDGDRIAVIRLTLQVTSNKDMTDLMNEALEGSDQPMVPEIESVDSENEFDMEGELLWNMTKGHLKSLTLEGESNTIMDTAGSISMGSESLEFEQTMYLRSEMESELIFE